MPLAGPGCEQPGPPSDGTTLALLCAWPEWRPSCSRPANRPAPRWWPPGIIAAVILAAGGLGREPLQAAHHLHRRDRAPDNDANASRLRPLKGSERPRCQLTDQPPMTITREG